MRFLILMFALIPLVLMGVGSTLAWNQHHKITTYQPVEATVVRKWIDQRTSTDSDGRRSTTYTPKVEYRYTVDGREYSCDDVLPVSMGSSRGWAQSVIAPYAEGQTTQAFYNPSNPSKAFLQKKYTFFPYIFILFPMLFLAIATGLAFGGGASANRPPVPAAGPNGLFQIKATSTIAGRRKTALIVSVGWVAVGAVACGHFFSVAKPPYGLLATIATGVYTAATAIPVGMVVYYSLLGRNISDAIVSASEQAYSLGEKVTVQVQQTPHRDLGIEGLEIGLVCEETHKTRHGGKSQISSNTCYEDRVTVFEGVDIRSGEALNVKRSFTIPTDKPPSSPAGQKDYPRYTWRIEIKTRIVGSPDYSAKCPIVIRGA